MLKTGIILLAFGIVYLVWPGIYSTGFRKKAVMLQQSANPEQDKKIIRLLGGVFVLCGLCLLAAEWLEY